MGGCSSQQGLVASCCAHCNKPLGSACEGFCRVKFLMFVFCNLFLYVSHIITVPSFILCVEHFLLSQNLISFNVALSFVSRL